MEEDRDGKRVEPFWKSSLSEENRHNNLTMESGDHEKGKRTNKDVNTLENLTDRKSVV